MLQQWWWRVQAFRGWSTCTAVPTWRGTVSLRSWKLENSLRAASRTGENEGWIGIVWWAREIENSGWIRSRKIEDRGRIRSRKTENWGWRSGRERKIKERRRGWVRANQTWRRGEGRIRASKIIREVEISWGRAHKAGTRASRWIRKTSNPEWRRGEIENWGRIACWKAENRGRIRSRKIENWGRVRSRKIEDRGRAGSWKIENRSWIRSRKIEKRSWTSEIGIL